MKEDLVQKCEELIRQLDEYEGELRDCIQAVANYRVRVREIMGLYAPADRGRELFDELDAFLAKDR